MISRLISTFLGGSPPRPPRSSDTSPSLSDHYHDHGPDTDDVKEPDGGDDSVALSVEEEPKTVEPVAFIHHHRHGASLSTTPSSPPPPRHTTVAYGSIILPPGMGDVVPLMGKRSSPAAATTTARSNQWPGPAREEDALLVVGYNKQDGRGLLFDDGSYQIASPGVAVRREEEEGGEDYWGQLSRLFGQEESEEEEEKRQQEKAEVELAGSFRALHINILLTVVVMLALVSAAFALVSMIL